MIINTKYYLLFTLTICFLLVCCTFEQDTASYIDDRRPKLNHSLFAKDFISKKSRSEFGSVFNKAQTEFFFAVDTLGKSHIMSSQLVNGTWSKPMTILNDDKYSMNDPFLSPDESKLYYISDMPKINMDTISDYDIWYSERVESDWSIPINAGETINTNVDEYYISFTESGAMYFASNRNKSDQRQHDFDIYKASKEDNVFLNPIKVGSAINTKRYEGDVFIAPDESYIIFCTARKSGMGKGDLYISFKNPSGEWMTAINMGPKINSKNHELCPFVTYDGEYLFYTSNQDIYWISTEIINTLRQTVVNH